MFLCENSDFVAGWSLVLLQSEDEVRSGKHELLKKHSDKTKRSFVNIND